MQQHPLTVTMTSTILFQSNCSCHRIFLSDARGSQRHCQLTSTCPDAILQNVSLHPSIFDSTAIIRQIRQSLYTLWCLGPEWRYI